MLSDWSNWSKGSDASEVLSCIFRHFARYSLPKANRALGGRKREKGAVFSLWRRGDCVGSSREMPVFEPCRGKAERFLEGKEVRICFSEGKMG